MLFLLLPWRKENQINTIFPILNQQRLEHFSKELRTGYQKKIVLKVRIRDKVHLKFT